MSLSQSAERKIEIARAYRAIFLSDDGTPTADGEAVLRDLEKECGWMVEKMPETPDGHVDPLKLAGAYEKRRIYAHVKKRIFDPLLNLRQKTMETK